MNQSIDIDMTNTTEHCSNCAKKTKNNDEFKKNNRESSVIGCITHKNEVINTFGNEIMILSTSSNFNSVLLETYISNIIFHVKNELT
ncbi:hypothetical protein A3Q56_04854 [Intoshia linei]|uniref:Uncharacterized protein n=1 Tax=Intoshia linei TaxID=1819745 RepID=A0A177B1A8_9BILA|nr:hypothetical protein A3Q56_04854 [Intoshia linei]